jgi:uncharacterized membrane protein YuzA (DUF378 family)
MKKRSGIMGEVAIVIAAIGAINWALVGLFKLDLVAMIAGGKKFGELTMLSRIIYIIIGIAGVWALIHWFGNI